MICSFLFFHFEQPFVVKPSKNPKKAQEKLHFAKFASKLPTNNSQEEDMEREQLFFEMDANDSGHLSLAEIEIGLRDYLGEEILLMKPAIKMGTHILLMMSWFTNPVKLKMVTSKSGLHFRWKSLKNMLLSMTKQDMKKAQLGFCRIRSCFLAM